MIGGWRENYRSLSPDFDRPSPEQTGGRGVRWRVGPPVDASGFRHGRHIAAGGSGSDNARFCNLFVQIARNMGTATDQFGSSDGGGVKGLEA